MPILLPNKKNKKINSFYKKQKKKATEYEESGCYSLAYLAKWAYLERIIKECFLWNEQKKKYKCMKIIIQSFEKGLSNENETQQGLNNDIGIFPLNISNSLPKHKKIAKLFDGCSNLIELMDNDNQYRDIRNGIAHKADKLERNRYLELSKIVDDAVNEVNKSIRYENSPQNGN